MEVSRILSRATKLIKKIGIQVNRFKNMTHQEQLKFFRANRFSSFFSLKDSAGREFFYGEHGSRNFDQLCELLLLFNPELKGRVGYDLTKKSLKSSYAKVYLEEDLDVSPASAQIFFEVCVSSLKSNFEIFEHHFPCVFFIEESPDFFDVGPVKFSRMNLFVANAELILNAGPPSDKEDIIKSIDRRAIDYYRCFPWVMSIKVGGCDYETSFDNAVFSCNTALNIIRVLFGSNYTEWVKLSTGLGESLSSARIYAGNNGQMVCSLSARAHSPSGPPNWYEFLNGEGGEYKDFFGDLIDKFCNFREMSELSKRLMDAINWFGDAALELSPGAAIVKYVTCIERLYFGAQYQDFKKVFSKRISKILTDFECPSAKNSLETVGEIYKVRSTLVHGAVSPSLGDSPWPLFEAENIAKDCILCALQIYLMLTHAFQPADAAQLEAGLKEYECNGLGWLSDLAARNRWQCMTLIPK